MYRRFACPMPSRGVARALGALLLLLPALGLGAPAAGQQMALMTVQNDWATPLVYVEAFGADAVPGRPLSKGRSTLVLLPNTRYLVFETANPRYVRTLLGSNVPELPMTTEPFMEFTTKSAFASMGIADARVALRNRGDQPVVFRFKLGLDVAMTLGAGQSRTLPPSLGSGFVIQAAPQFDSGGGPCMSFPIRRGWNYLDFPEGPDPCGTARARAAGKDPVFRVKQDRRYDRQSYLMAHNASENWADGWWWAQQSYSVGDQLRDHGVRALELDVTYYGRNDPFNPNAVAYDRDFYICHESCVRSLTLTTNTRLRVLDDTLKEVRAFIEDPLYRSEIVTIFIEFHQELIDGRLPPQIGELLVRRLDTSGLLPYVYWPELPPARGDNSCLESAQRNDGTPLLTVTDPWHSVSNGSERHQNWPLVGDMVAANQRVVLFISSGGYLNTFCLPYAWNYVRENRFAELGFGDDRPDLAPVLDGAAIASYLARKYVMHAVNGDPSVLERAESQLAIGNFEKQERPDSRMLMRLNHFPVASFGGSYDAYNSRRRLLEHVIRWRKATRGQVHYANESPGYGSYLPNFLALDYVESGDGLRAVADLNSCWNERWLDDCLEAVLARPVAKSPDD